MDMMENIDQLLDKAPPHNIETEESVLSIKRTDNKTDDELYS